jgi:predicted dehydrogenase
MNCSEGERRVGEEPLGVAVVGTRFGVQGHVPAFGRDARCEVRWVVGRDARHAALAAAGVGVRGSTADLREALEDPRVRIVSVAVPPADQPAVVEAALEAGKHVFCEKPLAAGLSEAESMLERALDRGVVHGVNLLFPEIDEWQWARSLVQGGGLGRIRHAALEWRVETYAAREKLRSWKNQTAGGGGVLGNFGSHAVHNAEWLFGRASSVEGRLSGSGGLAETCLQAVLEMEGGFPVFLSIASDAFGGNGHRWSVFGEEGALVLENETLDYVSGFRVRQLRRGSGEWERVHGWGANGAEEGFGKDAEGGGREGSGDGRVGATGRLVSRFIDAILGGDPMVPGFEEGVRVQRILDALRSGQQGRLV